MGRIIRGRVVSGTMLWVLVGVVLLAISQAVDIRIGAIYPLYSQYGEHIHVGRQQQAAIVMAINEINNKTDGVFDEYLPFDRLALSLAGSRDSFFGAAEKASYLSFDAFNGTGVQFAIGPDRATIADGSYFGFRQRNIPNIMYHITSTVYSESVYFPNMLRIASTAAIQGRVIAQTMHSQFEWDKVSIIYTTESRKVNSVLNFRLTAQELGMKVLSEHGVPLGTTDMTDVINAAKRVQARIFVIIMDPLEGAYLLRQGYEMGLFHRNTQIIGSDLMTVPDLFTALETMNASNISDIMRGFLGVRQRISLDTPAGVAFATRWKQQENTIGVNPDGSMWCSTAVDDDDKYIYYDPSAPLNCTGLNFSAFAADGSDIDPSAILAYDAVLAAAVALTELTTQNKPFTRRTVHDALVDEVFNGISGPIGYSDRYAAMRYQLGDRDLGLQYEFYNYYTPDDGETHQLVYVGEWTSEAGYKMCSLVNNPKYAARCHDIEYRTRNNKPPKDGPKMQIRRMAVDMQVVLIVLVAVAVVLILVVAALLYIYRTMRIVKLSQPPLQAILLLGCLLGCARTLIVIFPFTVDTCLASMWLGHLAFILIFSTMLAKTWRLHRVMNSGVKKVRITLYNILSMVGVITVIFVIQLCVMSTLGAPYTELVTVVDDQEAFIKEEKCAFGPKETITSYVLYGTETLLVLFGVWLTYASRSIPAGVSDFSKIALVILSIAGICVIGTIVVFTLYERPVTRQFILAILFIAAIYRCLYLLFGELVYKLMHGYDLDRNFEFTKDKSKSSMMDAITGKSHKSVASETSNYSTLKQQASMQGKTWTEEVLEKEIENCKAAVVKYQNRLLELQELAYHRVVLQSNNSSNPSAAEQVAPATSANTNQAPPSSSDKKSESEKNSTSIDRIQPMSSRFITATDISAGFSVSRARTEDAEVSRHLE